MAEITAPLPGSFTRIRDWVNMLLLVWWRVNLDHLPWHAIICLSGHEQRVYDNLTRGGWQAFWPRWVKKNSRGLETMQSLASGYMFVVFDGGDAVTWHAVRDACGPSFLSLIGGGEPVPILDTVFDYLRKRYGAGSDGLMTVPISEINLEIFDKNSHVLLTSPISGFLVGQIGKVIWSSTKGTKASFTIFGRESEIFVPSGAGLLRRAEASDFENTRSPQYGRHRRKFSSLQPVAQ